MKFTVEIKETLAGMLVIEAESTEEALRIAEQQYHDEHVILDSGDFQGVTFNARKVADV